MLIEIIVPSGLGVLILVVIVVILVSLRRRKTKRNTLSFDSAFFGNIPVSPPEPGMDVNSESSYSRWNTIKDVEIKEKLGGGNFGVVYRGIWHGGEVALKKLAKEDEESFFNEASVLGKLRHPNVVQYLGVHISPNGDKYIVMEFLSLGALNALLRKEENKSTTVDLVGMARQAAAGMVHLESSKIVHRDVSLRNLLVSNGVDGLVVKISDFGLSKYVESESYRSSIEGRIPIKWSAPELLEYGTCSTKSDVYSFGILLWELFSYGKLPFAQFNNDKAKEAILHGATLSQPDSCPNEIFKIMQSCWKRKPSDRPSFVQIYNVIEKFQQSLL